LSLLSYESKKTKRFQNKYNQTRDKHKQKKTEEKVKVKKLRKKLESNKYHHTHTRIKIENSEEGITK